MPAYQWPDHLPHDSQPGTYIKFFESHGFEIAVDGDPEVGVEKIALYSMDGEFRHVARQLSNGRWTSKIGEQEDIEHDLPEELENDIPKYGYGRVTTYLQRQRPQDD
jgi:hypothetical protein